MLLAGYVTPSYVEKTLKGPQQHSEIEALPAMANPCKRRIDVINQNNHITRHSIGMEGLGGVRIF